MNHTIAGVVAVGVVAVVMLVGVYTVYRIVEFDSGRRAAMCRDNKGPLYL